ncbi:hypothetical protein AYO45_05745 [Gammaproteobacteria bacterium SCGC AG-212-F23]|nr:hypothetical protein AYO45_05745 [Gammaproteobacteria bacterium SCGC AG-212-F23]
MPKIDFYVLSDNNRLPFACKLIEKAYKQRHRIYIHTDNKPEAHQLDELLWTYRDDSFLPHNIYGDGPEPAPPIQIGINTTPEKHHDILINLSPQVPEFYVQFNRILELVSNETDVQQAARERYRYYQTQGATINTHKL